MKPILVLSLLFALACASGPQEQSKGGPIAKDCGTMEPHTLSRGTEVRDGPDPTAQLVSQLTEKTPVCAGGKSVGFGYRRVTLPDGHAGYVDESNLD